jgi:thioredoxin 2
MEISSAELLSKINKGEKVIVEFWAPWCGPCKMMKPLFESVSNKLKQENSNIQLVTFNIESDRQLVGDLGIRSVPTIKGFMNGNEVFTEIGLKDTNLIMEMTKQLS